MPANQPIDQMGGAASSTAPQEGQARRNEPDTLNGVWITLNSLPYG